ncbi:hypothetical protein AKO1_010289 [Acrasis kona]|uniref:Late embryogenesis abundant protein LEA-2 subgroup domain-containing protein n=1 Tax=Acrasis kona TaxID=1008807 RepID=A0AAW2ZS41_9EUKA
MGSEYKYTPTPRRTSIYTVKDNNPSLDLHSSHIPNDLTDSVFDDDDEEFVYNGLLVNQKSTRLSNHQNDKNEKYDKKEQPNSTVVTGFLKLIDQTNITRRWRWGFCSLVVILLMIIVLGFSFLIYRMFFLSPTVYIEQVQLTKLPTVRNKQVGFKIIVAAHNYNFVDLVMSEIKLTATVRDVGTSSGVGYQLDTPLIKRYNETANDMIVTKRTCSKFHVETTIDLSPSPNFDQIQKLILNALSAYVEFQFEGTSTITRLGPLKYVQKLLKKQQYNVKIKGKT